MPEKEKGNREKIEIQGRTQGTVPSFRLRNLLEPIGSVRVTTFPPFLQESQKQVLYVK